MLDKLLKTFFQLHCCYNAIASADAYLTPCIKKYLTSFAGGFQNNLQGKRVLFMQSDGGLTPMEK